MLRLLVEESTRRVVRDPGVPVKLAAARKRIEVPAARYSPDESARPLEATSVQVVPFSHCQVPSEDGAALAVMTTPWRELAAEPPLTVSVTSEKRAKKRLLTVSPAGAVVSSLTAERVAEPDVGIVE